MSINPFDRQARVPGIKNVLLVGSGKGGVGKSTVAVNLALALKNTGQKVGLLDADIYGPSIPRLMGALNQKPSFHSDGKFAPIVRFGMPIMSMGFIVNEDQAVVWRGPMLFKAIEQFLRDAIWGELDWLIVDLPPGTGDIALTMAQKVPVTGAIVVTTPQNLALVDARKAVDMFAQVKVPLFGVVENMAHFTPPGSTQPIMLFPKGDLDSFLDVKKIPKLAAIPFFPSIGMCSEAGMPIVAAEPDGEVAAAFVQLAEKVLQAAQAQSTAGDPNPNELQ